ncbi:hypothetical protein ACTVZO_02655 [Streptomyces sp. IBSNAI002]|uniref:hypothetical protein n=1 Tax=Streptomyces sp. IBSNAI002 TaxID=3457500 RepID=UPI003FD5AB0D
MNAFLGELGKRFAERWLALLVLPGALFVAAVTIASVLGHRRALDAGALGAWIDRLAATQASGKTGIGVLVAAGVLAAAAVAGLGASALGHFVERLWTADGRAWPLRPLTRLRGRRWLRAQEEVRVRRTAVIRSATPPNRADPQARAALREAMARCTRTSLVPAERPTWIGDRLRAADVRVHHAYRVDLTAWWPTLWLAVPDSTRDELTRAHAAYRATARLTAWGLLYLVLGGWWWPAVPVAAVTLATAVMRARAAAAALAQLVEAAVDLYGREVAALLGVEAAAGALDARTGARVSALLRKDDLVAFDAGTLEFVPEQPRS